MLRSFLHAPKGQRQISPGQRPGKDSTRKRYQALKGRYRSGCSDLVSPFQGSGSSLVFVTQGVALGWYVTALSGRNSKLRNIKKRERGSSETRPRSRFGLMYGLPRALEKTLLVNDAPKTQSLISSSHRAPDVCYLNIPGMHTSPGHPPWKTSGASLALRSF
jgi:hypothetical protein